MVNGIALRSSLAAELAPGLQDCSYRAGAFPYLSGDEEHALAVRLRERGELDAAHQLVRSHLRMVGAIARAYIGYGLPRSDLVQEGTIGLMKAVKRFDPAKGARLATFALHWIHAEIREYVVRNWRLVKIATTKSQRKLFFNLRSMKRGERLSHDDMTRVSQQLHVEPREIREMDARLSGGDLEICSPAEGGTGLQLPSKIPQPPDALEAKEGALARSAALKAALETLDPRARRIVEARWLREDDGASLKDLAAELRVSIERVRQIQQLAFAKMRELLQARGAGTHWSLASD